MIETIIPITEAAIQEAAIEIGKETLNESTLESMLDTIESQSLESLEVENIQTINQHLEGTIQYETSVPYERKIIETAEGKIEGVFPNFNEWSQFDVEIPADLFMKSDFIQSEFCDSKLTEAFEMGNIDISEFNERQLEQIKDGVKPDGFTWHHHEEPGKMQLVPQEIHEKARHTGGRSIWGGGTENR